jgi:hypothetical protein
MEQSQHNVLEPIEEVVMLEVEELDIFKEKILYIDAVGLVKGHHLLEKHVSFGEVSLIVSRFDRLLFKDLHQNGRKLRLNDIVLVCLIAAVHHPHHTLNNRLDDVHYADRYVDFLNCIKDTVEWSRLTIM